MFVLKFEKWRTAALPELTNVEMVKLCLKWPLKIIFLN